MAQTCHTCSADSLPNTSTDSFAGVGPLGAAEIVRILLVKRTGGGSSTTGVLPRIPQPWIGDVFDFVSDAGAGLSLLIAKESIYFFAFSSAVSFELKIESAKKSIGFAFSSAASFELKTDSAKASRDGEDE